MFNAAPWLQGDAFDAVMNYRIAKAIKNFVIDEQKKISPMQFANAIRQIHSDYNWEKVLVCQNLMDSHDVDRLASQIVNPDRWYDHQAAPKDNPDYNVRKPNQEELARLRLIVALQMTLPGAPMVYYGDEAGMWGGDDPDCRKPMVWPELDYESETSHPSGKSRPADKVCFDQELFDWYRKMIAIRKENPVLSLGKIDFFHIDDSNQALGYLRSDSKQSNAVILNNSALAKSTTIESEISLFKRRSLVDLVSGTEIESSQNRFSITLAPFQIVVLK